MAGHGTGQPITFACPVARRGRDVLRGTWALPPGHTRIVRTGRTKGAAVPGRMAQPGSRMLNVAHEFVCECGHRGWSKHSGVLRYPVEGVS